MQASSPIRFWASSGNRWPAEAMAAGGNPLWEASHHLPGVRADRRNHDPATLLFPGHTL